ncbi:hypothetical protein ElyMa_003860500 [Elysia marginata]|uniref:Uncharacterized protein n=1 Tax=Elysia marginata TaxID=1093978 RepID=A0AAV4FJE7_9GAST|nr:hypothetical protein ElyMa_003860500 [Elysia marginata]
MQHDGRPSVCQHPGSDRPQVDSGWNLESSGRAYTDAMGFNLSIEFLNSSLLAMLTHTMSISGDKMLSSCLTLSQSRGRWYSTWRNDNSRDGEKRWKEGNEGSGIADRLEEDCENLCDGER